MIIGKRHFIIAALILALGAAVYLNWQFTPNEQLVTEASADYVRFEDENSAEYAAADSTTIVSAADILGEDVVEAAKKAGFFETARAERSSARNNSIETLQDIISDPAMSEAQKNEAISTISQLAQTTDSEAAIETLVKAKGYSDCVVVISDSQINVIIPENGGITSADAAVIRDIVMGQTDMPASAVKIVEAKK